MHADPRQAPLRQTFVQTILQYVNIYWCDIEHRGMIFWVMLSPVMRHGYITTPHNQSRPAWNGNNLEIHHLRKLRPVFLQGKSSWLPSRTVEAYAHLFPSWALYSQIHILLPPSYEAKLAFQQKRHNMSTQSAILLHDTYAKPHTAVLTQENFEPFSNTCPIAQICPHVTTICLSH